MSRKKKIFYEVPNLIKYHQVRNGCQDFSNTVTDFLVSHKIKDFLGDLRNICALQESIHHT